jgi:hypothetical protein
MKKFVFINEGEKAWLVTSIDQHNAIAKAVEAGYVSDMADFYYGLSDGVILVLELEKEI